MRKEIINMGLEDILIMIPKLFDFVILVGEVYCVIMILLLIVKVIDNKLKHITKKMRSIIYDRNIRFDKQSINSYHKRYEQT